MKFHRANSEEKSTAIYVLGSIEAPSYSATVNYEFDAKDLTVKLDIAEQWFDEENVDYLIEFLTFAKTQLKK